MIASVPSVFVVGGSIFINATSLDPRIKALTTLSLYDLHQGFKDMSPEALEKLANQRWQDVDNRQAERLPDRFGDQPTAEMSENELDTFDYYKNRGYHPNSRLSEENWNITMPYGFINTPLTNRVDKISPRPLLVIAGEKALLRPMSEEVFNRAQEPKELMIVPEAYHCTLYDDLEKIPFDHIQEFFDKALN